MNSFDHSSSISAHHVKSLIEHALKNTYKTRESDAEAESILKNCISLFGKDYKFSLLDNSNGELCGHYPSQIVLLEYLKTDDSSQASHQSIYDIRQVRDLVNRAKSARCRRRFAVPVILFEDKHICRGATISSGAEMYGRQLCDMFTGTNSNVAAGAASQSAQQDNYSDESSDYQMHDRVRGQDIRLLKNFNIGYIFDLMLERKKVKFGMNVTSSEKVDKENRYSDFTISSVPYPGCEFFRSWKDNGYRAEGLMFDWNQDFVDSRLDLPTRPSPPRNIDWHSYKHWDLMTLTQNYLKLLLHYLREGDSGMLVHCISGWDRTPLFISLLRLSLWAEGLVHPTLSAIEVLYLTIGYDWFLFGHNFPDRMTRGEDVLFFCFTFLKHITSDDFNVSRRRSKRTVSTADSECLLDGVLLDGSYRGSNSSISSVGSFSSSRSNADAQPPVYFSVGSAVDDDLVLMHSMQSSSSTLKVSPAARHSPYYDHFSPHSPVTHSTATSGGSHASPSTLISSGYTSVGFSGGSTANFGTTGSSPMPVPRAVQRLSSELRVASAASCGSWQLVSGAESYRSVPSPADSSRSHSGSSSHESRDSMRRQRLDEVRQTFVKLYTSVLTSNGGGVTSPDIGGAGALLSGLLEKVGFRSAYSGFI